MPLKSKAQHRFLRAAEAEGRLPPGTASRWWHHTAKKDRKKLPERVSEKKSAYFEGAKVAFEKLAVSQKQERRINAALDRMAASDGTGPLADIDRSGRLAGMNYGAGWRDLSRIGGRPTRAQLDEIFRPEKGLFGGPNESSLHSTDVRMMSPIARKTAYRDLSGTGAAAPFRPDPSSGVPMDVQRGRFLEGAKLKRFTFEPDRIVKMRAALSPRAQPVLLPPDPPATALDLRKRAPALGPVDSPHTRLWRGSERQLRPEDMSAPTWTSGHFDVAQRYADHLNDRVTAYRSAGIPTGHFTPHAQTDTRRWTAQQAAERRAANPEFQFYERVVNSGDLDPSRIESQYVRGTQGLYHTKGTNLFPTQSAVPYNYPQPRPAVPEQPWYGKLVRAAGRLAGKVFRRGR